MFAGYAAAVRKKLFPRLDKWAKAGGERSDAKDEGARLRALADELDSIDALCTKVAASTVRHGREEFKRIGVRLRTEPKLSKTIDDWRSDNVARVKGLALEEIKILEEVLAASEGRTPDELKAAIHDRLTITDSRAQYLARNQVSTLNGQITREQHRAAGIVEFVWTCVGDSRTRTTHAELDGQTFRWDEPPTVDDYEAIPGEPPNCRCVAFPILPDSEPPPDDDEPPPTAA